MRKIIVADLYPCSLSLSHLKMVILSATLQYYAEV